MDKPRIYFPIEIKNRELISRIYFAINAAKSDWSIVIGKKNRFINYIKSRKPGNYISKSIGDFKKIDKYLTEQKFTKSFIDEEGLMSFNSKFAHRRTNENFLNIIENYFLWGKNHEKEMKDLFPKYNDKFKISGNSRIDILLDQNVKIYKNESNKIKKIFGEFFLLTTKFGKVNYIERKNVTSWYDSQLKKGLLSNESQKKLCKKSIEHEKRNFENFKEFLRDYEKVDSELKILIKVHPSEDPKTWKNLIRNNNYTKIYMCDDRFYTNSYIMGCKALIQNNCTTSLEAQYMNKESLQLNSYEDLEVEYEIPKKVSKNFKNNNKIKNNLKKISDKENFIKINDEILNFYVENKKDIKSYQLILNNLEKNFYKKTENFNLLIEKIQFTLKQYIYRIKNNIFDRGSIDLSFHKFNELSLAEIKDITDQLSTDEEIKNIRIEELLPGLFIFEKIEK